MKHRVYVSGPLSQGNVLNNIRNAVEAGTRLADYGFIPFVPHLNYSWHLISPRPYQYWLDMDFEWVEVCHAVLRLPGYSPGGDKEVERAAKCGIPVFYNVEDLVKYFANR